MAATGRDRFTLDRGHCRTCSLPAGASAEIKLGKDFLDGIVEKLPPTSFDKADKYRGTVHSYRLVAIDPRTRVFLDRLPDRRRISSSRDGPDLRAGRPQSANARGMAASFAST